MNQRSGIPPFIGTSGPKLADSQPPRACVYRRDGRRTGAAQRTQGTARAAQERCLTSAPVRSALQACGRCVRCLTSGACGWRVRPVPRSSATGRSPSPSPSPSRRRRQAGVQRAGEDGCGGRESPLAETALRTAGQQRHPSGRQRHPSGQQRHPSGQHGAQDSRAPCCRPSGQQYTPQDNSDNGHQSSGLVRSACDDERGSEIVFWREREGERERKG